MTALLALLAALAVHVIDDFGLQHFTHLNELKQKAWWSEQLKAHPELDASLYKHDYIVCLFLHAFKWSCLTLLPALLILGFPSAITLTVLVVLNTAVHAVVDDLKANKLAISLVQDQLVHLLQIIVTVLALM